MKKTIKDYDLSGKRVIIRVDFNVPIIDGVITDDNRIVESIPTIKYALENNAKVILLSHLGRVETEADKAKNTLKPVAELLSKLLNKEVLFIPNTRGEMLERAIANMRAQDIILVENTRYEDVSGKKESSNDEELGAYWASLGDIFINDAFGTAHRSHASNVGITSLLPNGVGFLVQKELEMLANTLANPTRPFVVILGGAKVKDKIPVIEHLVHIADKILIGGGMSYTFQHTLGFNIGNSLFDSESVEFCKRILEEYHDKIVLPIDVVCAKEFSATSVSRIADINDIKDDEQGLDIGPKTIELFKEQLQDSNTIIWNGPLGVFEFAAFSKGTKAILEYLKNSHKVVIIGGGDTASAAINFGYKDAFTHISTGGGASLELLEGKVLAGIDIIKDK